MLTNSIYRLSLLLECLAGTKTDKVLEEIDNLETFSHRTELAEKEFDHLSSGSSRIVFRTPEKTVIKLAKNEKGLAQNKAEANPKIKSKYVNPVLKHSKKYNWIEVAFLEDLTEKQFEEQTGINFKDFDEALAYGLKSISSNKDVKKPKDFDKIKDKEIYKEVVRVGKIGDILPGDLGRISSWRMKDDHPILSDIGLTENIFSSYYDSKSS